MRIDRITVTNFIAFTGADIALAPGLNVILAPNEGGKSSLMQAVVTGLYRNASSRSAGVLASRRWGSESLPRIELRIHAGGEELRIVRDFGERTQYLCRGEESSRFRTGRDVDRYLSDALIVADEKLFVRVCGVRQEELASVADGRIDLGERLEGILSGGWGEVSPAQVGRELEEVRAELRRGLDRPANRENWGPLKRYGDEVERLERELDNALALEKHRAALLRNLSEARREREGIGLGLLLERKERAGEYASLQRKCAEAEGRMREMQQRKERVELLCGERERLRARGSTFPPRLRESDGRTLDEIRGNLEREEILRREIAQAGQPRHLPPAWLIIAALLITGGVIGWVLRGVVFVAAVALGVALLAWIIARYRGRSGALTEYRQELDLLGAGRREWAGEGSLRESREVIRALHAWRSELHETDVRLEEALRGYDDTVREGGGHPGRAGAGVGVNGAGAAALDSIEAAFVRLSGEWHVLRKRLEELEPFHLDAEGILRLDGEIERMQMRARDLDGTIASLEREMLGLPEGEVSTLREQLATAREALERARHRATLVDVLLEALEAARSRVAGMLAERLPPAAGRYLSVITGGRYGTVYVDPVTVHIDTVPASDDIPPGGNAEHVPDRVLPEALSQGARDQIYFAVRLAIVDLLSGGDPLPLLLDDPFVHFDTERKERALGLVKQFSERHQVLLFSCDQQYGRLGGTVVRL